MPARRPGAGPRALSEPSFQSVPSSDAPALSANSTGGFPNGPEAVRDIAAALHANLARGFLESEERFRQIADVLHDVVALTDQNWTHLFFVNAAYEQIWGRAREEVYANPLAFLDGVHPEDRERVRDAIFKQPRGDFDLEFRVLRPSGDQRWVWSRGFPVRDADGEIYRIASITEDITERVRVVESHERLIRGFTHDVKNPLGAADGYLSLLELGVFGEMSATQMEGVGSARRSIHTALDLVTQLLEIERAQAGQLRIERVCVDLGATIREIADGFRAAADAKRLSLTVLVPRDDDSLIIESDPARVRQILANLVSNAVKYTQPEGSIALRAYVGDDDAGPGRGRRVAIAVVDNGPGIPPEKQTLLFREFTRFSPGAAEGSGIGLAISQRLAHAIGAAITFKSTPGGGSTFTLWLPSDPPPMLAR